MRDHKFSLAARDVLAQHQEWYHARFHLARGNKFGDAEAGEKDIVAARLNKIQGYEAAVSKVQLRWLLERLVKEVAGEKLCVIVVGAVSFFRWGWEPAEAIGKPIQVQFGHQRDIQNTGFHANWHVLATAPPGTARGVRLPEAKIPAPLQVAHCRYTVGN